MTRFENQFPDLAAELKHAPVAKLRAVCVAACEYAVAQTKIEDHVVMEALTKLRAGEILAAKQMRELEALAERLDDEYFALAKAFDEGRASVGDYQKPFSKARAVSSLVFAFEDNPLHAASEAIYEASAVTDEEDPGILIPAIKALLKS